MLHSFIGNLISGTVLFVGSVGVVSLETIRNYIDKQGTKEKTVR
jgi:hypothetical protein